MTVEALLKFLADPGSYEHNPKSVEIIQTHVSIVALAGPLVFKVRKPVNFGFLDYSTLERRRRFSFREVDLNRRLCPDVYLGVVPIVEGDGRLGFGALESQDQAAGSADPPEDYAVKMARLDECNFLSSQLAATRAASAKNLHPASTSNNANTETCMTAPGDFVGLSTIQRIVETLVPFYQAQPTTPGFGTLDCIREAVSGNLVLCENTVGPVLPRASLDAMRRYAECFIERKSAIFASRVEEGRIRDCHGDLRPIHIHMGPNRVSIYDCIEFNDNLRCIDVAADLAFLGMELAYAGRWDLSEAFLAKMAIRLNDPDIFDVLDFYQAYRAAVRGKVAWLLANERELPDERRPEAIKEAHDFFRLALRFSLFGSKATVLCVMGRVGTGKSSLAAALGNALGWDVFSSDTTRKRLAGVPVNVRPQGTQRRQLYSPAMSERIYASITESALAALRTHRGAVLDATFGRESHRKNLSKTVADAGGKVLFVELLANDALIRKRLADREENPETISDARLEDFDRLSANYESPEELGPDKLIRLRSTPSIEQTSEKLLLHLADRHAGLNA